MIKKNYSKFEVKEEFGTLSFNNVLLYREDTKMYQVIFSSSLNHVNGESRLSESNLHQRSGLSMSGTMRCSFFL